jgi:integrase
VGSIRVREETGQLFLDFHYLGVRCREQTALPDTRRNRQKLRALMDRIEAEITLGTFDYVRYFPDSPRARELERGPLADLVEDEEPEFPTFKEFAWQWYEEQRVQWKQSHAHGVRRLLEQHLVPRLGAQRLPEIDRAAILGLRADLANRPSPRRLNGLAPQSINHIMTVLRMVLREGADRYDLPNPFRGIKPLQVGKSDVHPFSLEEVRLLLDHVRPDYRDYLVARFFTGMPVKKRATR